MMILYRNSYDRDIRRLFELTNVIVTRYQAYIENLNQIFSVPKIKVVFKYVQYSIISNPSDGRYDKVKIVAFTEYGLLDTGAKISCIGSDLATQNYT